jgi:RNA polymerase sigma factor (sigma-70 family)
MTIFAGDHDLLRRFKAGDRAALGTVYWHYIGAVDAMLRSSLGATGRTWDLPACADVADIAQEVFVKAFADGARRTYDPERAYKPFLMSIARNTLIDYLRGKAREVKLDEAMLARLATPHERDVAEALPWTDPRMMSLVERYVSSLDAPEREVYVERYVHCHSQEHAASSLGVTRQQIRTLEARLRSGLAREVARLRLAGSSDRRRSGVIQARGHARVVAGKESGGA